MVDATSRQTDNTQKTGAAGDDARTRASEAMLRDANQPGSTKAQKMNDVQNLAGTIVDSAMAEHKTKAEATQIMYKVLLAQTNEQRTKVFKDNGLTEPSIVNTLEAKYKSNFTGVIRQAVEDIKADKTSAPVTRVAETQTDRTVPVASAGAPAGDINSRVNDGWQKIGAAMSEVSKVQANGQPLPDSSRAVFENAVQAAGKLDPKALETEKVRLLDSIPNWTSPLEQQYTNLNDAFETAKSKLSQAVTSKITAMGPASADARLGALVQMSKTDSTAKDYIQSLAQLQQFADQNPSAAERQKIQPTLDRMTSMEHGAAVAEGAYSQGLLKTGNPGDFQQAIQHFNKAAEDKSVGQFLPSLSDTLTQLKAGEAALQQAQAQAPQAQSRDLSSLVPGLNQLQAADKIMTDPSTTATAIDKFNLAKPLFEASLAAAQSIPVDKLDAEKLAIDGKIDAAFKSSETNIPLSTAAGVNSVLKSDQAQTLIDMVHKDPVLEGKLIPLLDESKVNEAKRGQLLQTSEDYAQAMSQTAFELARQANSNPAQFNNFTAQAAQLNDRAVQVLKDVGANDSTFGVATGKTSSPDAPMISAINQKRVDAEIKQIQAGEVVNFDKATGTGAAIVGLDKLDHSVNGFEFARPLKLVSNVVDEAASTIGKVPVVGLPFSFAAGLAYDTPDKAMPDTVKALTTAKEADPVAAKAEVQKKEDSYLNQALSSLSDLTSGVAGRVISEKGVAYSLAKMEIEHNPKIAAIATVGLGLAAAFGVREAEDALQSHLTGSARKSWEDLASRSTASYASARLAGKLGEWLPDTEGKGVAVHALNYGKAAVTGAATMGVYGLGSVNPFVVDASTGHKFTYADTGKEMLENAAFGATGSMAGKAVSPYLKLTKGFMTQPLKFVIDKEAGAVKPYIAKPITDLSQGYLGTNAKAFIARGAVGGVAGAATGFGTAAIEGNGNELSYTAKGALLGAATFAGAPQALQYSRLMGRAAIDALPNEGASPLTRLMGNNLMATGERAGLGGTVGFGGTFLSELPGSKDSKTGHEYTWGESLKNSAENGMISAAVVGGAPFVVKPLWDGVNYARRALGTGADYVYQKTLAPGTVVGDNVVTPVAKGAKAIVNHEPTAQYAVSHSLPISTSLSGFYGYGKVVEADKKSDELVEADAKKKDAGN